MKNNNSELFRYVADVITLPDIQDLIEEGGGIITSHGLVWPIDTADDENTAYYYINVQDQQVYFLPNFETDIDNAELVDDEEEMIFVILNLKAYLTTLTILDDSLELPNFVLEIRFNHADTPHIKINPRQALYFRNFSVS